MKHFSNFTKLVYDSSTRFIYGLVSHLELSCILWVSLELTIIPDRLSVMQVVHFAHESTNNTYLTHTEIEQWYYYFTFFYNRFSSGNTILLSHIVDLVEWTRSTFIDWLGL